VVVDIIALREGAGGGLQMRYGFLDLSGVEQKLTQLILRIAVTGMRGDDGAEKSDAYSQGVPAHSEAYLRLN